MRQNWTIPWKTLLLVGIFGGIAVWCWQGGDWRLVAVWGGVFGIVVVCAVMQFILINGQPLVDEQRCSRCGYDLRASRDRCPECGAVAPKTSQYHFKRWLHLAMKLDDPKK